MEILKHLFTKGFWPSGAFVIFCIFDIILHLTVDVVYPYEIFSSLVSVAFFIYVWKAYPFHKPYSTQQKFLRFLIPFVIVLNALSIVMETIVYFS